MAAPANSRGKKPKRAGPNGHLNGHAGKAKTTTPAVRSSHRRKPQKTFAVSMTNIIGRLVSWYIICTVLFRCPSSITQLSETSPQICRPYLHARSNAAPYLDPYYQTYVTPQLEKVQPYLDRLDQQVYKPVAKFTKDKYATYGAHHVEQARNFVETEWAKTVRPQLESTQRRAKGQYDQYLAPYIVKASDTLAPFSEQTKDSLLEIYHLSILPAYEAALPYARQGYAHGHHVVAHIIFPNVRAAKDASWKFLFRTLWPQLRVLYGDNVEPQLVRIRERLGRYRDQQKIESAVDGLEPELPTAHEPVEDASTVSSPSTGSSKSGWHVLDDFFGAETTSTSTTASQVETKAPSAPEKPQLSPAELKEKLSEDLRNWQTKFAVAADKGAEDLEIRVAEITKRQVENSVHGHGAALVIQLEQTAESAIETLKDYIKQIVKGVPEDPTEEDLESAYEKCIAKTRELGLTVKEKAQAVRSWKATYDQETDSLVQAAVQSTVEVLDRVYGLGLQEVGMRWAWTDGVTYKDWQNYHKLRHTLTEWQTEVEMVGAQHEGLRIAHEEATKLEDKAMSIASNVVSELVRLKEVSKWKIWAEDASDDFSDKKVPPRTFRAARKVVEDLQDISSKASESIVGSETPASESIISSVKDTISEASSKLSQSVVGSETPTSKSLASKVKSGASEASEAIMAGESNVSSRASKMVDGVETDIHAAKDTIKDAVSMASEAPRKVMGGAMAQVLAEAKQVVFDDVLDDDDAEMYSGKVQGMVAEAGDRASELSRAVSEALLRPTKTQGPIESVTSLASDQYEKALAAASSVLYGTQQDPLESATSLASEKFAQAVTAASYAIYGTPTPTAIGKTVQSQASSRYNDAISIANEQYAHAKSQLSLLVSGTPKPAHETMASIIERAYADSLAAASERLHAALQYTDSVKSYAAGPTQGYFESVSSIASSRLAEGLSRASTQFSPQPTPALEGARRQYYEAVGLAHERYSSFVEAASSAFYGPEQGTFESLASVASQTAGSYASEVSESATSVASRVQEAAQSVASQVSSNVVGSETPWTESIASQASQNWETLIAKASAQVYGEPTPWASSVYSQAGSYATQAADQYSAIQALISELVVGKEPDFTESVMNRFSSAYYTGIPAAISSVNSFASENYGAATEYAADAYASASSVVNSIFTPPPVIEAILSQASDQLNSAVESASIAVYGTPKGPVEKASQSVVSAYSSIRSKASDAIYGTQQAQASFAILASSAQAAISEAIFGTPTASGYVASATSGAQSAYDSVSSAASEKVADAVSAASSAVYGPEQGAMESASSRLAAAVEAANSKISDLYASAGETVEAAASKASSAATAATQRVKDEL